MDGLKDHTINHLANGIEISNIVSLAGGLVVSPEIGARNMPVKSQIKARIQFCGFAPIYFNRNRNTNNTPKNPKTN